MQDRPEAPDLLDAVAELLIKEILPLVQTHGDDLTAYKTLVSWNMLGVVARELRNGEELLNDELARLKNLPELAAFFAKSNAQPGDAGAVSYRAGRHNSRKKDRTRKQGALGTRAPDGPRKTRGVKSPVFNERLTHRL